MLKSRSPFQLLSAAANTRRGFTLLEILVAVGAVALVSVGIAAIFDSVGKTVNTGRKMSRNQAIATRVEQQMRRDFSQISREGFLVIRQQPTSKLQGSGSTFAAAIDVRLAERDVDTGTVKRDRRIDEVFFFAKGKFTSAMEPLSPDFVAESTEAAIYYGHGQRRGQDPTDAFMQEFWEDPRVDDDLAILAQRLQYPQENLLGNNRDGNPNRFASDWILLRKPILLRQPKTARSSPPDPTGVATRELKLVDSDVQIAGQPAASSIFSRLSRIYPFEVPSQTPTRSATVRHESSLAYWADPASDWNSIIPFSGAYNGSPAARRPQISSGIVDIATTDLTEIRTIVTTCPARPAQISVAYDSGVAPYALSHTAIVFGTGGYEFPDPASPQHAPWQFPVGSGQWPISQTETGFDARANNPQGAAIFRMHSWMQNALPTRSDAFTRYYETDPNFDNRSPGCRIRCESSWTAKDDVLPVTTASGPPTDTIETYFKRRNQLALSAHNFLEHCSEFVVEWSFGLTDPRSGQIIWYGTPRQELSGADASREMTVYRGDHDPFDPNSPPADLDPEEIPYNPFLGMPGLPTQLNSNPAYLPSIDPHALDAYRVSKHLIYGNQFPFDSSSFPAPADTEGCFTSHFGYFDPSFNPRATPVTLPSEPVSPSFESLGISSLPWAWPKMVRITVRVADETDPTLEESFQFVIDLPPTPRP